MTSGVYKLTFKDGSFYFGKSNNIERRWEEHFTKMQTGKASLVMQEAYDRYGSPKTEIVFRCHPDHVDIFEACFINQTKHSSNSLNTSIPSDPGVNTEYDFPQELLDMGTLEHIDTIVGLRNTIIGLKQRIVDIKRGTALEDAEEDLSILGTLYYEAKEDLQKANKELEAYKSRGFFSRLFNLGV